MANQRLPLRTRWAHRDAGPARHITRYQQQGGGPGYAPERKSLIETLSSNVGTVMHDPAIRLRHASIHLKKEPELPSSRSTHLKISTSRWLAGATSRSAKSKDKFSSLATSIQKTLTRFKSLSYIPNARLALAQAIVLHDNLSENVWSEWSPRRLANDLRIIANELDDIERHGTRPQRMKARWMVCSSLPAASSALRLIADAMEAQKLTRQLRLVAGYTLGLNLMTEETSNTRGRS